jgi:phage gp29-like protein
MDRIQLDKDLDIFAEKNDKAKNDKAKGLPTSERVESGASIEGWLDKINPDLLIQNKGNGLKIYQEMLRDPYVKASLELKKCTILSVPRKIQPASSSGADMAVAEFMRYVFDNMESSFSQFLWGVLDALDCGYSLHERVYKVYDDGLWAGKWGFSDLSPKDPDYYEFELDKFSNIKAVAAKFTSISSKEDRWKPNRFFIYSHRPRYKNPYGTSDLRSAYRAFFLKDIIWKFRALYLEKFGMPPIIGTFPPGTSQPKQDKLLEVLRTIQTETAITHEEGLKITPLELQSLSRQTEYERCINDLNKEILIGILGAFLHVEEGKRLGVRAQQKTAMQVSALLIESLAKNVSDEISQQLFKHLTWLNFNRGNAPTLEFDVRDPSADINRLEIDRILVKEIGLPLSYNYFYKAYRRDAPSAEDMKKGNFLNRVAETNNIMDWVGNRRKKAMAEAGNGEVPDFKRAWREILDFCEARDKKSYATSIAHEMAQWEVLCKEKLGAIATPDEALARLSAKLQAA